jgi:hypothetical protein
MARPVRESATQPRGRDEAPLFGLRSRSDRLRRMAPERRAAYERIMKLRDEIGPIDFDVSEAVQQLRRDG